MEPPEAAPASAAGHEIWHVLVTLVACLGPIAALFAPPLRLGAVASGGVIAAACAVGALVGLTIGASMAASFERRGHRFRAAAARGLVASLLMPLLERSLLARRGLFVVVIGAGVASLTYGALATACAPAGRPTRTEHRDTNVRDRAEAVRGQSERAPR